MSDILRNTSIYSYTEKYVHNNLFQAAQQVEEKKKKPTIFKYLQMNVVGEAINTVCTPFPPKLELFLLPRKPRRAGNFHSLLVMLLVHGAS